MYNSNTDLLGLILGEEVFFSLGHCSGALCPNHMHSWKKLSILLAQKIIGELAHAVTKHALMITIYQTAPTDRTWLGVHQMSM